MGQYWELINIDRDKSSGHLGKLGEFFFNGLQHIHRILRVPTGFPGLEANSMGSSEPISTLVATEIVGASATFGLLGLPMEVIAMIFEEIEDISDALMLAVTHKYFLAAGQRRIKEFFIRKYAPWAGDRLICLGDYANDLPEWMFAPEEQTRMRKEVVKDSDDPNEVLSMMRVYNRHKRIRRRNRDSRRSVSISSLDQERKLSGVDRIRLALIDRVTYSEGEIVLCNISKGVYVGSFDFQYAKGVPEIPVSSIILSKICWSSDPSASMLYKGNITRGEWAGDRFVYTTMDRMPKLPVGMEWRDVTEEVLRKVKEIWLAEYGEGCFDGSRDLTNNRNYWV